MNDALGRDEAEKEEEEPVTFDCLRESSANRQKITSAADCAGSSAKQ